MQNVSVYNSGGAFTDAARYKPFLSLRMPFVFSVFLFLFAGCGDVIESIEKGIDPNRAAQFESSDSQSASDYYDAFYQRIATRGRIHTGVSNIKAIDALPKDGTGNVSWTAAVMNGFINPKGSLDPDEDEDPVFNLNIFIEAKVPLMANVIFPHSIHTYWLSCNNCHPKIFIPEAGANPITMDEIFKGEWCGRCHGKVAFTFWPRSNCTRCHSILKGLSGRKENF